MKKDKALNILLMCMAVGAPLFSQSPNTNKYLFFLAVIFWLVRGKISFKNPVFLPLFSYLGLILLSGIVGLDFSESFKYFLRHSINFFIIFLLADTVRDTKMLKKLVSIFLISAVFVSVLGVLQFCSIRVVFLRHPLEIIGVNRMYDIWRISSTRGHPVTFADNIALWLPLLAAVAVYRREFFYYSGVVLASIALILTFSRTAILSTSLVFTAAACRFFKKMRSLIIPFFIFVLGLFVMIASFHGMNFLKNRISLNPAGRQFGWEAALQIVKKYPLFGVGIGNASKVYKGTWEYKRVRLSHFHNTFIQVTVESGLFGVGAFLWFLFEFFREILRRLKSPLPDKESKFILAGIFFGGIAVFLAGMTNSLFCRPEEYYPLYFLMGLSMSKALKAE